MLTKPQPPRTALDNGWQGYVQASRRYGCFVTQSKKDVCYSTVEPRSCYH